MLNTGHIQAVFAPKAQNLRIGRPQGSNMKESRHFCVDSGAWRGPVRTENVLRNTLNTAGSSHDSRFRQRVLSLMQDGQQESSA